MLGTRPIRRTVAACLLSLFMAFPQSPPEASDAAAKFVPADETLVYKVEWRLIHAGNVKLSWRPSAPNGNSGWQTNLDLESVGLVSRLYKVDSHYSSVLNSELCAVSSLLQAQEGSRRRETVVTYDPVRKKASLQERDLIKKTVNVNEVDIPPCVSDVVGALYRLRAMRLEPGQSAQIPISDGKKTVQGRVEAQERETIKINGEALKTIRYEAFLFNNVLYRRRGRLFVWITDNDKRLPVQVRVRMPFYIGTVTLELQKDGKG